MRTGQEGRGKRAWPARSLTVGVLLAALAGAASAGAVAGGSSPAHRQGARSLLTSRGPTDRVPWFAAAFGVLARAARSLQHTTGLAFEHATPSPVAAGTVAPAETGPASSGVAGGTASAPSASGVVRAGDSKTNCIYVAYADFRFEPALTTAEQATGVRFNCLETFVNGTATWAEWETPWVDGPAYGFTSWKAADPGGRTLVLGMNLVPDSVDEPSGTPDPSAWEPGCAAGADNAHAAALARNLVAAGFGDAVIRLGFEMNGSWEPDFTGTTPAEQRSWAACFAQEAGAMRAVPGAHFLFDWNPNACVGNFPLSAFYPGNAAVDLVGVDAYDAPCSRAGEPTAPGAAAFQALAAEPDGLDAVTAFAARQHKPMSLPEWGTQQAPTGMGDDGTYVRSIGAWVAANDVAFQCYFDRGDDGILTLSAANPNTLHAYATAFGGR